MRDLTRTSLLSSLLVLITLVPAVAQEKTPPPPGPDHFLLAVDGRPVAWTAPHGQSIHWFGG